MQPKRHAIDMVHHNPGEPPLETIFSDPLVLRDHGFTGQAFKHINTVVRLPKAAKGLFPSTAEEKGWLECFTREREVEITRAKAAGLEVFYHIDLFVLPRAVVEYYRDEICDPITGRISLLRDKTLELHRELFAEIFERWPAINGLIVRVGETYLMDTPHHVGNGAVDYGGGLSRSAMIEQFVHLLNFLRAEICVKHGRWLIHRTWDTHPDRFHADAGFYTRVTQAIEPHAKLVFSIKHTQFDFHRFTSINPCLGLGKHAQIMEVQCQREYEGKGAYPNYIVRGLIHGFSEMAREQGVRDFFQTEQCLGLYTWTRGGGWYGPKITCATEFWPRLNFAVLAEWWADPASDEAILFQRAATKRFGLSVGDTAVLRKLALLSGEGVLKGKLCSAYDGQSDRVPEYPTNMWMRDDVLHGYDKLALVFDKLRELNAVDQALGEKREALSAWRKMRQIADQFSPALDHNLRREIVTSVEYGLRFFGVILAAWELLLNAYNGWRTGQWETGERGEIEKYLAQFQEQWCYYRALPQSYPGAAGLYRGEGWHWPTQKPSPSLLSSIEEITLSLRSAR
jgi:hypothetical protein